MHRVPTRPDAPDTGCDGLSAVSPALDEPIPYLPTWAPRSPLTGDVDPWTLEGRAIGRRPSLRLVLGGEAVGR